MRLRVSAISFSFIQAHYAWKMCSNYLGIKLEPALGTLEDKIEHLSSYAHVVHTTAKQVILRRRKNENVYKMSKNEESTCKACKSTVFHCQMCKFVGFFLTSSSWLLKLPTVHISRWRWLTWTVIQLYKKEPLTDGLLFQTTSAQIRLSPNALTLRKSTTRDKVVCDSWFRFHVSVSF